MWCRATTTPTVATDSLAGVSILDQTHDALKMAVAEYCDGFSQDAVMPAYLTAFGLALSPSWVVFSFPNLHYGLRGARFSLIKLQVSTEEMSAYKLVSSVKSMSLYGQMHVEENSSHPKGSTLGQLKSLSKLPACTD